MEATLFKQKYMSAHTKLYRIAYRLLEDASDAEDMVQETYAKLWSKRKELNDIENGESYAVVILRNLCLDHIRSRNRHQTDTINEVEYQIGNGARSAQVEMEQREDVSHIEKIIDSLPDQQRMVIKLRHWDDKSLDEIEEITGLSDVNVRVLLSRARKKIKDVLAKSALL